MMDRSSCSDSKGSNDHIVKPVDDELVDAKCLATMNPESSFKTTFRRPQGTSPEPLRVNQV